MINGHVNVQIVQTGGTSKEVIMQKPLRIMKVPPTRQAAHQKTCMLLVGVRIFWITLVVLEAHPDRMEVDVIFLVPGKMVT